jgi:nitrilase
MIELLCTDDTKRMLLLPGGGFAGIYAPDGQLMTEPLAEDVEGIVYADLDLGMISLAKAAADPSGHYSRPDVTRLLLNKTPGDRVVPFATPGVEIGGEIEPLASTRAVVDA